MVQHCRALQKKWKAGLNGAIFMVPIIDDKRSAPYYFPTIMIPSSMFSQILWSILREESYIMPMKRNSSNCSSTILESTVIIIYCTNGNFLPWPIPPNLNGNERNTFTNHTAETPPSSVFSSEQYTSLSSFPQNTHSQIFVENKFLIALLP